MQGIDSSDSRSHGIHAIEQESLNINKLEQVLVEKGGQLFMTRFNVAPFSPICAATCADAC
jgi:hypothetical protein